MKKDNTLKCLQCSKLLLINNNYTNDILYHKDKIWCDTKNNKIKNINVCNWCYYYVWRPV